MIGVVRDSRGVEKYKLKGKWDHSLIAVNCETN
jgi:hypothetical protein